ncbi:MAG: hypothetical protein QG597_3118 [Actinomycetota bacterium]|nr:hypothetical protein [Actinomycetota bacterium]
MDITADEVASLTAAELRIVLAETITDLAAARSEVELLETMLNTHEVIAQLPTRDEPTGAEDGHGDASAEATSQEPSEPPAPLYPHAIAWVNGWMFSMTARTFPKWCEQWWEHPEAEVRIEGLWRSWEVVRLDPNPVAMSSWILHHFDPHIAQLSDTEGPFTQCTRHHHTLPRTEVNPAAVPACQ